MSGKEQNSIGIHMFRFGIEQYIPFTAAHILQGFEHFLKARYLQCVITKPNTRTLEAAS
jgi:hypothetical protein